MPNGRCRMHGGKSTGPRTPEGFANLARAHTTHGLYAQSGPDAELRAEIRHARIVNQRVRLNGTAFDHLPWLPPALAARLRADTATELHAPVYPTHPQPTPASIPKLETPTNTPCNLRPSGQNPVPRRDARGRFAARPKPALRGRRAEREAARQECERLAPWRAGIEHARQIKRLLMHEALSARAATRAQNARTAILRTNTLQPGPAARPTGTAEGADKVPMHRGTVKNPTGQAEPAAALPPPAAPHHSDTPAQNARIAILRTNPLQPRTTASRTGSGEATDKVPMHRGTAARPTGQPGAADAGASTHSLPGTHPLPSTHSLQRGAGGAGQRGGGGQPAATTAPEPPAPRNPDPPPATQPHQPNSNQDRSNPMHPCTVRPPEGPFRRALLSGTASDTPQADKLATHAEHTGGWPVIAAAAAATHAGLDWRPAATAVRQRLIEDANRQRARHVPRLAPEPDPVRAHGQPDAP
jgi:hypothetical protein